MGGKDAAVGAGSLAGSTKGLLARSITVLTAGLTAIWASNFGTVTMFIKTV